MAPFRFRLARVLDWYQKQSHIEEERLRLCAERAVRAKADIERHQREVLAAQTELLRSPRPDARELAALGPWRRGAGQREEQLRRICATSENELDRQRGIAQVARRRRRLVENLRDRRLSEHQYAAGRELEELSSEAHLAGFARALADETPR